MTQPGFVLDLPIPPSLNNLYPGKTRRRKSDKYKAWITAAGWEIKLQRVWPVTGPYAIRLELPAKMRGDVDGRLKAALDLLVQHRLTSDDRLATSVQAVRSEGVLQDRCRITVEARS